MALRQDKKTLLIVEDDIDIRTSVKELLTSILPIGVIDTGDGKAALEIIRTQHVDVILTDIKLPAIDGLEFASCVKASGLNVPIIFFTAYADKESAIRALRLGAFEFIEKPFQVSFLVDAIKRALSREDTQLIFKLQGLNLSSKQTEVLDHLLRGKTNREIGDQVNLTEPTVKYHVGELFRHFSASSRFELKEKVWQWLESKNLGRNAP